MTAIVYTGLALWLATGLYLCRLFRAGPQIEQYAKHALHATIVDG